MGIFCPWTRLDGCHANGPIPFRIWKHSENTLAAFMVWASTLSYWWRVFRCGIDPILFYQRWPHMCPSSLKFTIPVAHHSGLKGWLPYLNFLAEIFSSPSWPFHSLFLNCLELKFQSFLQSPFVLNGEMKAFLCIKPFLWLHLSNIWFVYSGFPIGLFCQNPANHIKGQVLSMCTVLWNRDQ